MTKMPWRSKEKELSDHLTILLDSHILPTKEVAELHLHQVETLMKYLEMKLPYYHKLFEGCKLQMFGSVANQSKICEMDEFDVNIVLNIPFIEDQVWLNFDGAPPLMAFIEVSEEMIEKYQDDIDIFFKNDNNRFFVAPYKIEQILCDALSSIRESLLASDPGCPWGISKKTLQNRYGTFHDVMIFNTAQGYEYFSFPIGIDIDFKIGFKLPSRQIQSHPRIPQNLDKFCSRLNEKIPRKEKNVLLTMKTSIKMMGAPDKQ